LQGRGNTFKTDTKGHVSLLQGITDITSGNKGEKSQNKQNDVSENTRRDNWQVYHALRNFYLDRSIRTPLSLRLWPLLTGAADDNVAHGTLLTDSVL